MKDRHSRLDIDNLLKLCPKTKIEPLTYMRLIDYEIALKKRLKEKGYFKSKLEEMLYDAGIKPNYWFKVYNPESEDD